MHRTSRRTLAGGTGARCLSVYDDAPGIADSEGIRRSNEEGRILITNDKDFDGKVYCERYPHSGIVLLRLDNERSQNKISVLRRLLKGYADRLPDQFVVATAEQVRFAG